LHLANKRAAPGVLRKISGYFYEVMQMRVDNPPADRLYEQRLRIEQAKSIVVIALRVIDDGADSEMAALRDALSLVRDTLDDVTGKLEPASVLKREVNS
jgi:hypothetical protein